MNALDIISVAQAKRWLSAPDEADLERLIESAINFVEVYTGHTLIEKEVVKQIPCNGYALRAYPMTIVSVKNGNGDTVAYQTQQGVYNTYIFAPRGTYVTMNTGYETLAEIPGMLVEVAYKMLTYLYENRDIYTAQLPMDFQIMVNKYRRNLV